MVCLNLDGGALALFEMAEASFFFLNGVFLKAVQVSQAGAVKWR